MGHVYEFGQFRLHETAGKLTRGDDELHLTAKGFATLLHLVERAGTLVPKDELLDRIWPDGFVEPANLTQTIYVLRKTLDDAGPDGAALVGAVCRTIVVCEHGSTP